MIPTKEEWKKALEERHGQTLQQKFASASVAVCGLGGLGSNISLCLARAGIGRLILIDFDRVDITNLHRQQYKAHQIGMYKTEALAENLREIAPYLSLELHTETMTEENTPQLLQNAQIICEAFDRAENKPCWSTAYWKPCRKISGGSFRNGRNFQRQLRPDPPDYFPFLSLRRRKQRHRQRAGACLLPGHVLRRP